LLFVYTGWIAGLLQGLGSLLSPLYIPIYKKMGVKRTFAIGFVLCFVSMIVSSFVTNPHYLFLAYSLPFGIGSSLIFVLGTIVTGMYFPLRVGKHHVTATVLISLGFPLGYLVMNPLTEMLMSYYNNDWQLVQRVYAAIIAVCAVATCPLFTDSLASKESSSLDQPLDTTPQETLAYKSLLKLDGKQIKRLVQALWLVSLVLVSLANNSILIHLVK
jgi:MFS family permease